jgi:periplasmic protein TonB
MRFPKDQPFWTSVILHLVVLLGLFVATIVQAFKPKEKPHVFEMVEPPSEVSQSAQPSTPQPPPPEKVPPVELPPVPQVDIPKPPPPSKPIDTPQPKPSEQPLMTADDFFKSNPRPDPKQRPVTRPPNITVPKIDVPKLIMPQSTPRNPSPQLSQQQMSELADYSSRLRSRIDAAWIKPAQLAGVNLVAEVVFNVSPSGQITHVRLRRSSGNTDFDQSILAALRRATSAGPTPTGQTHEFSLPFRMGD